MNLFASSFETEVPSDLSAPSTTPPLIPESDYGTASSAPSSEPSQLDLSAVSSEGDEPPFSLAPPDTTAATCLIGVRSSYVSFKAELIVVPITHTIFSLRFLSGARPTKSSASRIDRLPTHA
jgi:hypothetical protein